MEKFRLLFIVGYEVFKRNYLRAYELYVSSKVH